MSRRKIGVVVAAGAWTTSLLEGLDVEVPIFPMRLQIVQTGPMPRLLGPVLYGPGAVKQYLIFREMPPLVGSPGPECRASSACRR